MLWRRPWGQHLEISVLSSDERQRPEDKLGAERKFHVETPRCHGLLGLILSASPYLARLCRRRVLRYLDYDREKRDDVRSISRMNTARFRLIQALSRSNSLTYSFTVLCCGLLLGA
jgi:hypothetical protein